MVPELTHRQRLDGAIALKESRRKRAEVTHLLETGLISIKEALDDERASRMYVRRLIASVPGLDQKEADEIMLQVGIAPTRRVRGLGVHQRERLVSVIDGKKGHHDRLRQPRRSL